MARRRKPLYNRRMSFASASHPCIALNSAPTWFKCAPDWSWAPRALSDYDLWFVAAGRGDARFDERDCALRSGLCFVWRPGDTPLATHDVNYPLEVFGCHFDWHGQPWQLPQPQTVHDVRFFEASAHRAIALWARGDARGRDESRRLIEAMLWQLHDESTHPRTLADAPMEELAITLNADLSRSWSLNEMARLVHLSRAQLVRRFRARYGASPMQWLGEQRIEAARHLLLETDWTLEAIAHQLGWNDAAFFSRQFKARVGVSPGSLRR